MSLGQSAIYLTGGTSLEDPVDALLLHSGDVLVMSGAQRLVYHAVPRIVRTVDYSEEDAREAGQAAGEEWAVMKRKERVVLTYANECRVNVTIRQVDGGVG